MKLEITRGIMERPRRFVYFVRTPDLKTGQGRVGIPNGGTAGTAEEAVANFFVNLLSGHRYYAGLKELDFTEVKIKRLGNWKEKL